jgi:hypothetical protein
VNACRAQWTCERRILPRISSILLRRDWRPASRSTRGCGGRAFTMGLTPHVRLASPRGGEGSIGCRLAGDGPARCERVRQRPRPPSLRTRPTSPSPPIAANASDIALDPHRDERVPHRPRHSSVHTRPTTPSTLTGTNEFDIAFARHRFARVPACPRPPSAPSLKGLSILAPGCRCEAAATWGSAPNLPSTL